MDREEILAGVREKMGFVPGVIERMAVSPALARVYLEGNRIMAEGILEERERQAVCLATSVRNGCHYCANAHSVLGRKAGLEADHIASLRAGEPPADERLALLAGTVRLLLEKRGHLGAADLQELAEKGLERAELYEILGLVSLKQISNWVNHIERTPVDRELQYEG